MDTNPLLVVHYSDLICIHKEKQTPSTTTLVELKIISCIASTCIPKPLPCVQCF